MGAAYYIVLEKEIPGLDTMFDGKMLSNAEQQLAELAQRLGVRPLMEFFSINPEDAGSFLEGEGVADVDVPAEQWFPAEDGLRTVTALLGQVESSNDLKSTKDDLLGLERVLREAQKQEVRWHLAIDF